MSRTVIFNGMEFASKQALIAQFREILYRDKLDTEIVGDDAKFVEALLHNRPDKVAELGERKVVRYLRMMHRHNTPGLFAELDDGAMLDISFMKFISAYPEPTTA